QYVKKIIFLQIFTKKQAKLFFRFIIFHWNIQISFGDKVCLVFKKKNNIEKLFLKLKKISGNPFAFVASIKFLVFGIIKDSLLLNSDIKKKRIYALILKKIKSI
ncbi:MAG: hypothetical protein JW917_03405, partial [Ignavibacteria bacterium]|nr:hypothetical protein [Ignavibacteria bacterium]